MRRGGLVSGSFVVSPHGGSLSNVSVGHESRTKSVTVNILEPVRHIKGVKTKEVTVL